MPLVSTNMSLEICVWASSRSAMIFVRVALRVVLIWYWWTCRWSTSTRWTTCTSRCTATSSSTRLTLFTTTSTNLCARTWATSWQSTTWASFVTGRGQWLFLDVNSATYDPLPHPFYHFSLLSQARPLSAPPLRHGNINSQSWKYHVNTLCLPTILLIWATGPSCSTYDLAWTCIFTGACYPSHFNTTDGPCNGASLVTVCPCCILLREPYPTTETSETGAVVEDLFGGQYQKRP